ncbi:MAG: hypothetical protein GQ574_21685 [Crocinitomix sp.]|nr:hypothetical protein [Crocinitomix sp.]
MLGQNKKILQAKIDVRYHSRELIKVIFMVTEDFPKNDPDQLGPLLRKKALGISSFLTHGTVKSDKEEQNEDFLVVMSELREVLKLITIANHLRFCGDRQKAMVRLGIANVIDNLDKLVVLTGGFKDKK